MLHYDFAPSLFGTMRRELDDAFEQVFGRSEQRGNGHAAAMYEAPLSLWEDDSHVYLELDVPGFRQEDLDITFEKDRLWIRGERHCHADRNYWRNERSFGRFERWIAMPEVIDRDSISAELHDGVLFLSLAKKPEAKATKIDIKCASSDPKVLTDNSEPSES